jgi:hypothetical protein
VGLAFGDLTQVAGRELNASAVAVERDLPSVSPRPERALGHFGEAEASEDLSGVNRAEQSREVEGREVADRCRRDR